MQLSGWVVMDPLGPLGLVQPIIGLTSGSRIYPFLRDETFQLKHVIIFFVSNHQMLFTTLSNVFIEYYGNTDRLSVQI